MDEIEKLKELHERKKKLKSKLNIDFNFLESESTIKFDSDDILSEIEKDIEKRYRLQDLALNTDNISDENEIINKLKSSYNKECLNMLVLDCKNTVLESIIKHFGICAYIAKFDKEGGNVNTIHNVRKDIYATNEEKDKYLNKEEYNSNEYHSHKSYIEKNREGKILRDNGELVDQYTGKIFKKNDKYDLDHTISAKEIHDDKGRVLAGMNGPDLANSESNLNHTHRSINRSKKAKTMDEFIENGKNKENLNEIDEDLAREKDYKSRKMYEKNINDKYYSSSEFKLNTAKTSLKEGAKLGIQQALGLVLQELTVAIFDELNDSIKNGFRGNNSSSNFWGVLQEKLVRIAKRIISRWDDIFKSLGFGFFSGFISNIITVIINKSITTSKNGIRFIREGIFSLLKALKLLFFKPEGMTLQQAAHEATKLVIAGLGITSGILLDEALSNILPFTPLINGFISPVISGIIIGISTAFLVHLINQIDLFDVEKKNQHEYLIKKLNISINNSLAEAKSIFENNQYPELI